MFFIDTKVFYITLLYVQCSDAWGAHGHNITAELAYGLLSPVTVHRLSSEYNITTMEEFRHLANYADEIKRRKGYEWSYELHYTDVDAPPLSRCTLDMVEDCISERCVVGAINNYTVRLSHDHTTPADNLRFLVHFIGDIFQPFHMGYASDRGGNTIHVVYLAQANHPTNLHAVWDTSMIEEAIHDVNGYERFIDAIHVEKYTNQFTYPEQIGNYSLGLICRMGLYYDGGKPIRDGTVLSEGYYHRNIQTVIDQLAYSAHYMAYVLNRWAEEEGQTFLYGFTNDSTCPLGGCHL